MARLIPFPYPMNIGTDICHITRVESIMKKSQDSAAKFIRRIMAEEELVNPRRCIKEILKKPSRLDGSDAWVRRGNLGEAGRFMAGRFAAKEAIIKAHPHRRLTFHDIIIKSGSGATATDGDRPILGKQQQNQDEELSLTRRLEPDAEGEGDTTIDRGNGSGAPTAIVKGVEYDQVALVSISHDGEYATAVCLGFRHEGAGGGGDNSLRHDTV